MDGAWDPSGAGISANPWWKVKKVKIWVSVICQETLKH